MTKLQEDQLNKARLELKKRLYNGEENLFIKYIKGVPIVTVSKKLIKFPNQDSDRLQIYYQNIHSTKGRIADFRSRVKIQVFDGVDIFILTEAWLNEDIDNSELGLNNYSILSVIDLSYRVGRLVVLVGRRVISW